METRIHELAAEIERLKTPEVNSMLSLPDSFVYKATGFVSRVNLIHELERSGAKKELKAARRDHAPVPVEFLPAAAEKLKVGLPAHAGDIDMVLQQLLAKEKKRDAPKDKRGATSKVNTTHQFMLVFCYIVGGFEDWQGYILPGIRLSQSHFSRLFAVSAPIVAQKWAPRWFCHRSLEWLKKNSPPTDADEKGVDAVIYWDGTKKEEQRSTGMVEQRNTYGYDGYNMLQFIGVTIGDGRFIAASAMAGGRMKESHLVWGMEMWELWQQDAAERHALGMGDHFHLKVIADRGFRDNKEKLEEEQRNRKWPYKHLKVTIEIVHHLGTKENPAREQHPAPETEHNRAVQARRWVNEKAFVYFDISRFFKRIISARNVYMIDSIKEISLAVANMIMEERVKGKEQNKRKK